MPASVEERTHRREGGRFPSLVSQTDCTQPGRRRHILNLADATVHDKFGGARKYAHEIAMEMAADGNRISFLVPKARPGLPDEEEIDGLRIRRYGGHTMWGRQWGLQRAFADLHASDPVDAVIVHFAYTALGYHMLPISERIPLLRMFQGPWDGEHRVEHGNESCKLKLAHKTMFAIERYSLQRSHRIVTLSQFMATEAVERYGIDPGKIVTVPAGVDVWTYSPADKAAARRRLGIPHDAFLVFTVRRLARRMGLNLLIEAAAMARRAIPNLHVWIGGQGPIEGELRKQMETEHVGDCARLIGYVPDEQLPDYYRAADVFVLPSTDLEGFGLVILEALACNTPVLGSPVGAIPEVLSHFDPDLVLRGVRARDIALGLMDFYHNRRHVRRDFCREVRRNYTWKTASQRLLSELSHITGTGAQSA